MDMRRISSIKYSQFILKCKSKQLESRCFHISFIHSKLDEKNTHGVNLSYFDNSISKFKKVVLFVTKKNSAFDVLQPNIILTTRCNLLHVSV